MDYLLHNEPAISLPVYFKSVKNDNVLRKKKQKQNKTKGQKKNISLSKSRTPDLRRLRATRYLLRHDITSVENWRQIKHL